MVGQKCDRFQAFLGALARYPGECVAGFDEKAKRRAEKESFTMSHHIMRESPSSKSAWQRGRLSEKLPNFWFLHTPGEARLIALVRVTDRSTERKLFLEKDDLKK